MKWVGIALALVLSSCISTSKPIPEKRYYVLELPVEAKALVRKSFGVQVNRFRISGAYEGRGLTYRLSETEYESDYYHEYFASPGAHFSDVVRQRLMAGNRFEHVVSPGSLVDTRYTVEGVVNAAYSDLRDPESPRAVLHMQFFVIDTENNDAIVVSETFQETEPCGTSDPAELIAGLSSALNRVVTALEVRLAEL